MAAELSAGRTLFYQAVGFGALNWMQAESSVILKHELLGYEKTHLAWRERRASFAYGFFSLYLAEGAARLLGPPVISAFRRTSQSSWLRDVAPGPIRKYVNLVSTKSYYDVTSQFGREGWKVIEDQVVEGLSRSTSGNILLFAYGQGLGFAWGIKNILLNPNILPVWTPSRQ
jgi:hypothetical protein